MKKNIIEAYGIKTKVWIKHEIYGFGCGECCTGDRCDENCKVKFKGRRKECVHCKGTGWIPLKDVTYENTNF